MAVARVEVARAVVRSAQRVCVITGAGVSTDSGIPDYRSPGRPPVKSIQYNDFVKRHESRQRYWARSMRGYTLMMHAKPNEGHRIVHDAQRAGAVHSLITQNVDGLHQKAGSEDVVELHGSIHHVVCMGCGDVTSRAELQDVLVEMNPASAEALQGEVPEASSLLGRMARPDGDSIVETDYSAFAYPSCASCGGLLKPHVVFFGENLPPERSALSSELARDANVVVVAGTSLAVWSAFRLVRKAAERGAEVVVVTRGPTRADELVKPELRFNDSAAKILGEIFR